MEFDVALNEDPFVPPGEFVGRGDVTDGTMQANMIVVMNEAGHKAPGVVEGQRASPDEYTLA